MSKLKSEVAPKGINFRPATEFMLGDKYLVAPVLKKGQFKKIIKLPNSVFNKDTISDIRKW